MEKIVYPAEVERILLAQPNVSEAAVALNRAFTADFEVFGTKAQDPPDAEVDFYVAIKN